MLAEFVITFRESLEAALAIGIILAYLERTGNRGYYGHVWGGVFSGVGASVLAALAFLSLEGGFEGASEQVFEGALMFLASAMLAWMMMWMTGQGDIRGDIEGEVGVRMGSGRILGIAALSFISVFREGVETIVFITASAAKDAAGTLPGIFLGAAAAVLLAWRVFKGAAKVNLKAFFSATGIFLIILGAGLLARGVYEFQEAGWLPAEEGLWTTKGIIDDEGYAGSVLRVLTGYEDTPTPLQALAYFGYLGFAATYRIRRTARRAL
jgi:high-affinity iron transporter